MTKRTGSIHLGLVAAVAALQLLQCVAADLTVPAGGLAVTEKSTYSAAVVSGPLTVSAGVTVSGLTEVKNGGSIEVSNGDFVSRYMSLAGDVCGTDGVYDLASLSRTLAVGSITNESTSVAARIIFHGGSMKFDHTTGSIYASSFMTKGGSAFILEGSGDHNILLWMNNAQRTLAKGDGTVRFRGKDVQFRIDGANGNNIFTIGNTALVWENTGDLNVYGGGVLKMGEKDRLPHANGIVRISGAATTLDLAGKSQKLKGLVSEGIVKTGSSATELQFGTGGSDCVLAARLSENVIVAKDGAGTLTVSNSVMDKLLVREGTVKIATHSDAGRVAVSADATLIIDGCELTLGSLTLEEGAAVSRINGGTIVYDTQDADMTVDADIIGADGGLAKTGNGNLVIKTGSAALSGAITVKEGCLKLQGKSCHWPFYRYSIKSAAPAEYDGVIHTYAALGKLYVVSADGSVVSDKLAASSPSVGAEPSTLEAGTATSLKEFKTGKIGTASVGHPSGLFQVDDYKYGGTAYQNDDLDPSTPLTWERIIFRLADGVQPATGYKMRTCWTTAGNQPTEWMLEASPDGKTWLTLDERSVASVPAKNARWYNSGNPYELQKCPAGKAFSATTKVQVDGGAVLDLDYVDDSAAEISSLVVDCGAGVGTITKFLPAATGSLYLIGEDAGKAGWIPVSFGSVKNIGNLGNWSVYINGRLKDGYSILYKNGALEVLPPGFMIIVR